MSILGGGMGGGFGGAGRGGLGGGGGASRSGSGGGGKASVVPQVGERDFEQSVLLAPVPVLVQFTAEWSQPCKQIAAEVEAFAEEVAGKAGVVRVDVDQAPTLVRQLRVQSLPTFMLFAERRLADAQVGPLARKQLRAMLEPFLPRQAGALKPLELAALLKEGSVAAVDTRDAHAFKRAHVPGATNLPLEELEGRLAELYMLPGTPVVYCRGGDKTKDLAQKLDEQGVQVAFLEGGFLGWEAEGLPIQRG